MHCEAIILRRSSDSAVPSRISVFRLMLHVSCTLLATATGEHVCCLACARSYKQQRPAQRARAINISRYVIQASSSHPGPSACPRSLISPMRRAPRISNHRLHHAPEDEPNGAMLGSRSRAFVALSRKSNILKAFFSGDAMRYEGNREAAHAHYRGTPTTFHVLAWTLVSRRSL